MSLRIRPERESDHASVYELVKAAFATAKAADGDEQDFVVMMREHQGYIPALSLVAEKDGDLAGFVMLTQTHIEGADGDPRVLLLAPLCIAPEYQGRGIGAALMAEAFARARERKFTAVFLAGDPAYYKRFGFRPTVELGIGHALDVPDQYILVSELFPGALDGVTGTVILTGHTTCAPATGQQVMEET